VTCTIPEAATFADAIDCLGAGLLLLDARSRIHHANASAQAMLDERSALAAVDGRLRACEGHAARSLREAVARAAAGTAEATAVPLPARDGGHFLAHIVPLAMGARQRADAAGDAIAAVLVHKVALDPPAPTDAIAGLYGLTPSEVRVLLAIVEVGGVRETAEALGIGEATVKTHLHRLFCKTGAARQADLVKLVAGFANPIIGRSGRPATPRPCGAARSAALPDAPAAPFRALPVASGADAR
jgi:DNA-binding CsgD family transcriptional regulator